MNDLKVFRWVAIGAALLNFAFIPSIYFGTDPKGFYTASGWGPSVGATFPFLIWILIASISMIMKRQPGRKAPDIKD
jgi:hypothetical protein